MTDYRPRIADALLKRKLEGKGAVLTGGPRRCGKTTAAEQIAASVLYMDEPQRRAENVMLSELDPQRLLRGETPRFPDEWQLAPKLWDAVRFETDHRGSTGQFILTGSALPPETDELTHSGAGRFSWLRMRTMSLYESGDSTGDVSLSDLFFGPESIDGSGDADIERLAFLICRGGWPQAVGMRPENAPDQAFDYCEAIVHSDLSRADGVRKSPDRVRKLMRSYARAQGAQAAYKAVGEDMGGDDGHPVSAETAAMYIGALKSIFVTEDMPAWNPNLRSKTAVRTSDTRYYSDPSIATAALGLGPDDLLSDLKTLGLLFETLAIRDLRIYADALNGEACHCRDKDGLECDAVIRLRNGSCGLAEIRLGGDRLIG